MQENSTALPELEGVTPASDFEFHLHRNLESLMDKDNSSINTSAATKLQHDFLESYSVAWEKNINLAQVRGEAGDFSTSSDRNLLVTVTTKEEGRLVFENINPEIIACQIASTIRNSKFNLSLSPLELLSIGIEIGNCAAQSSVQHNYRN